jgi:hypothetical protein
MPQLHQVSRRGGVRTGERAGYRNALASRICRGLMDGEREERQGRQFLPAESSRCETQRFE